MDYLPSTMSDTTAPASHAAKPNPWTARIGLIIVGTLLVSCFGLLIAAAQAG